MNTHFQHHPRRLYTWTTPEGLQRNQIDFVLTPRRWFSSVTNVKTYPGADCGSDHELLLAKLKVKLKRLKKEPPPLRYDLKLMDNNYGVDIKNKFNELLLIEEEQAPDEMWSQIKDNIYKAAKENIPVAKYKKNSWISNSTLDLIDLKRTAKRSRPEEYKRLRKEVRNACRKDKQEFVTLQCERISQLDTQRRTTEMYSEIRKMTKAFSPKLNAIRDEKGKMLTEKSDILDRWKQHCEKLFNDCQSGIQTGNGNDKSEDAEPPPLRSEFEKALKELPNGKSPGVDQIPAELIKASGEEGVSVMHRLCCRIWNSKQWPEDWRRAVLVTLPKKGDFLNCNNYRTISLISHASKLLLKIIGKRLEQKLEEEISDTQAGFRRGRGTRDQVFALKIIIQKFREFHVDTSGIYVTFVDYAKAFDSVIHSRLWSTMRNMGFPGHIIGLLESLYENQESAVRTNVGTTDWFKVTKGVRQGCCLSPQLFNIYTEQIMRNVLEEDRYDAVSIGGRAISELRYADDTVLLSKSEQGLSRLLESNRHFSEEAGLLINTTKMKLMKLDRTPDMNGITLNGKQLEEVTSFEYLGVRIQNNGDNFQEVRKRLTMGIQALGRLKSLWRDTDITTRMKVLKAIVFPMATYGCESWVFTGRVEKKITAYENKCTRKILRIPYTKHVTNEEVRKVCLIGKEELLRTVKRRKLKFFGHMARHNSLQKTVMEGRVAGRRGRGRPRRSWEDDVKGMLNTSMQGGWNVGSRQADI